MAAAPSKTIVIANNFNRIIKTLCVFTVGITVILTFMLTFCVFEPVLYAIVRHSDTSLILLYFFISL